MTQLVPVSYLYLFRDFILNEYSLDLTDVFRNEGYGLPDDPTEFVSFEYFSRVCEIAVEKVADPALGLKYGSSMSFTNHGPLGAAMISCNKVSDIFDLINRFANIRFPFQIKLLPSATKTICYIHYSSHFIPLIQFHSQVFLSATFKFLYEEIGSLHKDVSIEFPYSAPSPDVIDDYRNALPVTLMFDKPELAINIPNAYLAYCLPKYDQVSNNMFVNICENIKDIVEKEQSLSGTIERLLDVYNIYPNFEQIADNLNISGRTLRSHLQKENTSFRKIVSSHRIQRSRTMLSSTNTTIEVIASTLGYSDAANFNRAFKKETGLTPSTYRKKYVSF